ncbi:MAG: hypothetical protein GY847_07180 [Proteobacteria bacterium]|nr:hypothetical protein [Pseudomonadota bacterium]
MEKGVCRAVQIAVVLGAVLGVSRVASADICSDTPTDYQEDCTEEKYELLKTCDDYDYYRYEEFCIELMGVLYNDESNVDSERWYNYCQDGNETTAVLNRRVLCHDIDNPSSGSLPGCGGDTAQLVDRYTYFESSVFTNTERDDDVCIVKYIPRRDVISSSTSNFHDKMDVVHTYLPMFKPTGKILDINLGIGSTSQSQWQTHFEGDIIPSSNSEIDAHNSLHANTVISLPGMGTIPIVNPATVAAIQGIQNHHNQRNQWEENGLDVTSCEEFAYERYYRYGLFEDYSAQFGEDYWRIFRTAYGMEGADEKATLHNKDIYERKSNVMSSGGYFNLFPFQSLFNLLSNIQTPMLVNDNIGRKNSFFEAEVINLAGFRQRTNNNCTLREENGITYFPYGPHCMLGYSSSVVIYDEELWESIAAAKEIERYWPATIRDWDYHLNTYESMIENQGYDDDNWSELAEELYVYDELKEELERLLVERHEMIVAAWNEFIRPKTDFFLPDGVSLAVSPSDFHQMISILDNYVDPIASGVGNFGDLFSMKLFGAFAAGEISLTDALKYYLMFYQATLNIQQTNELVEVLNVNYGFNGEAAVVDEEDIPEDLQELASSVPFYPGDIIKTLPAGYDHFFGVPYPKADDIEEAVLTKSRQQLYYIDLEIAEVLRRAFEMGCFTTALPPSMWWNTGEQEVHACDWSPRDFVRSINLDVSKYREKSYSDCIEATGGFAFDGNNSVATKDDVICGKSVQEMYDRYNSDDSNDPWNEYYTQDTTNFEQFLEERGKYCEEQFKAGVEAVQEMNEAGEGTDETKTKGNDLLGLTYGYSFTYGIDPLSELLTGKNLLVGDEKYDGTNVPKTFKMAIPEESKIKAHAAGDVHITAQLFGEEKPIIGVKGHVEISNESGCGAELEFKVVGNKLLGGKWYCEEGSAETGTNFTAEVFSVKARFSVGPIPMSVTGGIAGGYGIEFGKKMEFDVENDFRIPGDGETVEMGVRAGAGFFFAPYAKLDVFAELGIDLGIIAMGVRGDLTLIDISFPFEADLVTSLRANILWERPADDGPDGWDSENLDNIEERIGKEFQVPHLELGVLNFDVRTNLDAVLRMLDGKVSLYAKVNLGFAKKTFKKKLFGWKGLENRWNLLNFQYNVGGLSGDSIPLIPLIQESTIN